MAKEIFTELFNYYEISRMNDTKNRRIRKVIKERLAKAYPSREWAELTDFEKQTFKLVTMKDYLIEESKNKTKIERKIKAELENTLYEANKALSAHNNYIDLLFKQFYDESASIEENHDSYLIFSSYCQKYFPSEIPPTYEEWIERPLRLYDIQQSIFEKNIELDNPYSSKCAPVSQSKIDHVILECVLLILENKLGTTIDIASIRHCLEMTQDIDFLNTDSLQSDVDISLPESEEEQKRQITYNLDLMQSIRKLDEHDFIKENNRKEG